MELDQIIFYGVLTLGISILFRWLSKASQKGIELNTQGFTFLRLHPFYRIIGYLALLMTLILSIGILLNEEDAILIVFLSWLVFGSLGVYLLLWYYKHEVKFDPEGLEVSSWLGKVQDLQWSEIDDIRFAPLSGQIKMKGNGKTLKIHQHLVGLNTLLELMEEKTIFKKDQLNLPFS